MILTDEEQKKFERVLEIVTYKEDGKPDFTEEAIQIMETLAAGFKKTKDKFDKHPDKHNIDELSAADTYTHLLAKICEAPIGIYMEMSVVLLVPEIVEKLNKERH